MKQIFPKVRLYFFLFATLISFVNLAGQTPYTKPAPYHSIKDYQDAHPASKYTSTPTRVTNSSSYTPSNNQSKTSAAEGLSFSSMIIEPLSEGENQASILMAKHIIDLIQSSSVDFQGYKGELKSEIYHTYRVINTDFFESQSQEIDISEKSNGFILNSYDAQMIKTLYYAFVKQIPILTINTLKFKSHQPYESLEYPRYTLSNNEGTMIAYINIGKDLKYLHLDINYEKKDLSLPSPKFNLLPEKKGLPGPKFTLLPEKVWLTNTLQLNLTKQETTESKLIAAGVLKLLNSASNGFIGFRGTIKENDEGVSSTVRTYSLTNTDFFHPKEERVVIGDVDGYIAEFVGNNNTEKQKIKNVYMAILKELPLLNTNNGFYKIEFGDSSNTSNQYILTGKDKNCNLILNISKENDSAMSLSILMAKQSHK